jgi:PKD repeat protein
MIRLVGPIVAAALICWAVPSQAAGLRAFANVPLSAVPPAIVAGQGEALLEVGYIDVTRAPYSADPTGTTDAADAFQAAIDDGRNYNFAVYVPKGTYLLSHPIQIIQEFGYGGLGGSNSKFGNQLIGDTTGGNPPVLKAQDGAMGTQVFVDMHFEGGTIPEARFYVSMIRGFVLDMGQNPGTTALSLNGAQYTSIEDIEIRGNFDVGIRNLPGSGGSTTNVRIVGGNTGIWQDNYRPTPSVHGLELIGQALRGIHHTNTRGSLILAGFKIEGSGAGYVGINTPNAGVTPGPRANLVLMDGSIDLSGGAQFAIDSRESSIYMRNVFVRAPTISRNGKVQSPVETLAGDPDGWLHVREHAFAGATNNSPLVINGVASSPVDASVTDMVPVAAPPDDLIGMHAWNSATFPTWWNRETLDVRDFGATPDVHSDDDAPAINQALQASAAQGKPAFLPRGFYHVRSTVEVPAGAELLGSSITNSVIKASPQWLPATCCVDLFRTANAVGEVMLVDFAIDGHEGAASQGLQNHRNVTLFHGRTSNTLFRDVQINRQEYWAGGQAHFQAPAARLSGNAGGRFYNFSLAMHHASTAFMHPDHRMILIDGTHHPLAMYQPNAEGTENDPQTEIRNANNVTWYGFKFEHNDELLHIVNSRNVLVLGGSGNYALEEGENSIIEVNGSTDVALAILARQGAAGSYAFVREDGVARVPGISLVSLYKKGSPIPFGELDPPPFPGAGGEPPPPPNQPPIADAGPDLQADACAPLQFDGSASSDPDGTIVSYSWDFGDGNQGSGPVVSHGYCAAGDYTVTLTVTDDDGTSDTDTALATVSAPPPPENQPPAADAGPNVSARTCAPVQFDGTGSSDPDGTIAGYSWDFGDGTSSTGALASHPYCAPGTYTATLTVTDDDGAQDGDTRVVTVVEPPPPPPTGTLHVGNIAMSAEWDRTVRCRAIGRVRVLDQDGAAKPGVAVRARWSASDGYNATMTRSTNASGVAELTSAWRRPCPSSFTITVQDLIEEGYVYNPAQNVETADTVFP